MSSKKYDKMHIIAVDMGYGHQRAAYPFLDSSVDGIISCNNYEGIDPKEKKRWESEKKSYEKISYLKKLPIIGNWIFSIMDYFQKIDPFYPERDLSKNSYQQKYFFRKVKQGLGKKLIENLTKNPKPFLTTFFVSAYFAEYYNYPEDIYCVVCDADISRAWAPVKPNVSKIKYLAPNKRVKERLQLYGVKEKNIYLTGFPLPKENVGKKTEILKKDLIKRLYNLDPEGVYRKKYQELIKDYLCPVEEIKDPGRPLTLTFAVGGAGAQRKIAISILKSLKKSISEGKIKLNLIAGSRPDVYNYFKTEIQKQKLDTCEYLQILYKKHKLDYFKEFNKILRETDILWTKPSELTFYSGLGLPILMAPPIGSQEHYNREWLNAIGSGIDAKNPKYTNEWLFNWLDSGWFAEAAMQGLLDAPSNGTYNIESIVLDNKIKEIDNIHLL